MPDHAPDRMITVTFDAARELVRAGAAPDQMLPLGPTTAAEVALFVDPEVLARLDASVAAHPGWSHSDAVLAALTGGAQ